MAASSKTLFESMTRRRVSCPQVTQQLWDTIKTMRNKLQVPTADRIQKVMLKEFGVSEEEVKRQLSYCVRDGLIELTKRTVSKGSNAGSEQEWYKLPVLNEADDEYDWYCFDCHRAGDVICCTRPFCQRVFHLACFSSSELPPGDHTEFVCHVCRMCDPSPDKFQMKRSKLNRLLGHVLAKLKSKHPLCLRDCRLPPPNKKILVSDRVAQALQPPTTPVVDESDSWRGPLLIARQMNLTIIEEKIDKHRYRMLEKFHADCLQIVHNMIIYNGVDSAIADIARQMLRDCVEDLNEIRLCVDCYKGSHGKKKNWFCKPCRKPHALVYAKQEGLPYWPAKVMKIDGDMYDVRLFGMPHQRHLVPKQHIRPISVNIHTLQVKRSSAWNRACEELKKYQELHEKVKQESRNFTHFVESSSDSDTESLNSEQERDEERNIQLFRLRSLIEKQSGSVSAAKKGKPKRRMSVSTVVRSKEVSDDQGASSLKKQRGRPKSSQSQTSVSKTPTRQKKTKKEIYDSSDSLDSFHVPPDSAPKRNPDEMFDELLKSENVPPPPVVEKDSRVTNDDKSSATEGGKAKPPRTRRSNIHSAPKSTTDLSLDSMSSFDTDSRLKRHMSKLYTSSDSDSISSSELSKATSRRSSVRAKPTPNARPKRAASRAALSPPSSSADRDSDANKSLSSSSSDSEEEPVRSKGGTDRATKRPPPPRPRPPRRKALSTPTKPATPSDSSDSESLASFKGRSKPEVPTEVGGKRQSARTKPPTKQTESPIVRRKPKAGATQKTPPQRASRRNLKKPAEAVNKPEPKKQISNDSSDSETPLSSKQLNNKLSADSSDSDSKSMKDKDSDTEVDEKPPAKGKVLTPNVKPKLNVEETVVSSSSQEPSTRSTAVQTDRMIPIVHEIPHKPDRITELEKELQKLTQTNRLLDVEFDKTKVLIDRMRSDHDDEIADLAERHRLQVSDIKKKQWCYNCEMEAIYHCCWNTAYCSVECQQAHWQSEHKRVCRRKR